PQRFFDSPIPSGPNRGAVLTRERFLELRQMYYHERGWTDDGRLADNC
ncbi:MAG: hypothetical protein KDA58_10330, partial [Planctomycetaceae bacterium]|nr:hypothetical protein [Planctomycetaceae bacterium]